MCKQTHYILQSIFLFAIASETSSFKTGSSALQATLGRALAFLSTTWTWTLFLRAVYGSFSYCESENDGETFRFRLALPDRDFSRNRFSVGKKSSSRIWGGSFFLFSKKVFGKNLGKIWIMNERRMMKSGQVIRSACAGWNIKISLWECLVLEAETRICW